MSKYWLLTKSTITPLHALVTKKEGNQTMKTIQKKTLLRLSAFFMAVPASALFSVAAWAACPANEAALQVEINAAAPGTVDISGCTVPITTTLTIPAGIILTSDGTGVLQADPSFSTTAITPVTSLTMGRTYSPMVHVTGTATISNITIDGNNTNGNNIDGIYADAGTVTITHVTVENIAPLNSGSGYGSGIVIVNPANAVITNSTFKNIAKNSIDFASTGTLTATGNTITGPGPNPLLAQNGILVRGGTATVSNNTISGLHNSNTNQSSGITAIGGVVTGTGNKISNSDNGVSSDGSWTATTGAATPDVTLQNTTFSGNGQDIVEEGGGTAGNTNVPVPSAVSGVPTVSDGALAALGLLLAGLAAVTLRRRTGAC